MALLLVLVIYSASLVDANSAQCVSFGIAARTNANAGERGNLGREA
jgi:hypothetical protein